MLKEVVSGLERDLRIEEISWAGLPYKRPRKAGCNARLGVHGWGGDVPVLRIRIGGVSGFGWCSDLDRNAAQRIVGIPVRALFNSDGMLREEFRGLDFAVLDWLGRTAGKPVYRLVANRPEKAAGALRVPCYDTTIYFDELEIGDDAEAVEFICREVDFGLESGHRNFKVKIGRPGMWMDLDRGMKRDIDIILAVRKRIGPDGRLMADANNGYNLNLAKRFLKATQAAKLYWIEEPFHEDDQLDAGLKRWMKEEGIDAMIADGEGWASGAVEEWAKKGLIDVLQYDLRNYGFFRWMKLGRELDRYGVLSAPHNYGGFYGNYAQTHFSTAVDGFAFAEWDQAEAEGIDASAYRISDGAVLVPDRAGFGLELDGDRFESQVERTGWKVRSVL